MSGELHYSGSFSVSGSPEEVIRFITDLPRAVLCIPNMVSHEVVGEDRVRAKFRVDLGNDIPIAELRRVTTDATIELISSAGNEVRYRVDGRAVGSTISVLLTIRVVGDEEGGSQIHWDAVANLGRLLRMVGRFVDIDSLVKRISEDTIQGFIKCLSK